MNRELLAVCGALTTWLPGSAIAAITLAAMDEPLNDRVNMGIIAISGMATFGVGFAFLVCCFTPPQPQPQPQPQQQPLVQHPINAGRRVM